MSNAISPEALRWALRQFNFKDFVLLFQVIPSFKNVLTRGGFTLNAKNFHQENTTRRLLNTLTRREDLAKGMLTALVRRYQESADCKLDSPEAYEHLETHWREVLGALPDARPFVITLYHDETHPRLARLAEMLLHSASFWQSGKIAPRRKSAQSGMAASGEKSTALTTENPHPGKNARTPSRQPALPGLLPLTKPVPVQGELPFPPEENSDATDAPTASHAGNAPDDAADVPTETPAVPQGNTSGISADISSELAKLRSELAHARQRNGELSRENDALRKNSKTQQALRDKEHLADEQKLQVIQKQLDTVRDDFEDAICELKEEFTRTQTEQMTSFYADALGIHPDQLAMLYETQNTSQNLRSRVEKILARQREMDKKYGTMQKLRAEEKNLDQLLGRVREAMDEALCVAPGLPEIAKELETTLGQLRTQLRKDPLEGENPLHGFLSRLTAYIKGLPLQTPDVLDSLEEVGAFLATPLARRLFDAEEQKVLQELLGQRRQLAQRAQEIARDVQALPETPSGVLGERMVSIHRMSWHITELRNVEIFLDGYNIIKLDPFMSARGASPCGFQAVRTEFIERCKRVAKLFRKLTLVFDSDLPTDSLTQVSENFTLVYAGRRAQSQNADNWIIRRLEEWDGQKNSPETKVWLVTNDLGLRARASEICDGCVDNTTFVEFLG